MKINSGTILIGFFAVLCGLVAVHLYREANKRPPQVAQPVQATPEKKAPARSVIPMVSRNLVPGQKITMDDVALVRMSAEERKSTGLNKAFMTNPDQIIGKTVKVPLRRGDTFDTRDFYPVGTGPGISHRVKPGFRAITVALSPANALIGFAGPGQHVDVLFHYGVNGGTQQGANRAPLGQLPSARRSRSNSAGYAKLRGATATLAQGVEILALNHGTTESTTPNGVVSEYVMVTLSVRPRDAEALRVARGHGELSLTLRGPTDKSLAVMPMPSTVDDLINIQQPSVSEMEIFRGNSVSRMSFVNSSGATIKPQRISLPQLNIHVPAGMEPQYQFNPPKQSEPNEFDGQQQRQRQVPATENANQVLLNDPQLKEDKFEGNQFQTNQFNSNMLEDSSHDAAMNSRKSAITPASPTKLPHATQQNPNVSQVATRPSMPGIRFSDQPYNKSPDQQGSTTKGMPNSLMSSGTRDYRATNYGPYGLERK